MQDGLHLGVGGVVGLFVETQVVLALGTHACLVKNAEYLIQMVVHLPMQTGYLHDDAVVVQTVDKRVWQPLGDRLLVIVEGLMAHIDDRLLDVAHGVAQQVDGHHRQCVTVDTIADDVLRILIVHA